jgi:hypothetical protein
VQPPQPDRPDIATKKRLNGSRQTDASTVAMSFLPDLTICFSVFLPFTKNVTDMEVSSYTLFYSFIAKKSKSSVGDVVSMATVRLCKAKTCHASVFAAHNLAVAHFWKQAMSASECIQTKAASESVAMHGNLSHPQKALLFSGQNKEEETRRGETLTASSLRASTGVFRLKRA